MIFFSHIFFDSHIHKKNSQSSRTRTTDTGKEFKFRTAEPVAMAGRVDKDAPWFFVCTQGCAGETVVAKRQFKPPIYIGE
jgi:hypothetical protein